MELNEAFASEAFTRLLKRIISLEKANKEYKSKMTALERNFQKEKETASKQITSLTNKVQQLSDQINKQVKSGLVSSASVTGPTLEAGNCWLSSAERLGLKKNSVEIPKPSQMEVKITNAIFSEQADRERRKKNLLIFGVIDSYSNLTTENDRKEEIQKQDKEKVERIVESIGANKTQIVSIIRFKPQIQSQRAPPILVRISDEAHRNNILSAAKKLRTAPAFKDVYINADLTEKERIQEREIREQRRALRKNLRMDSQE